MHHRLLLPVLFLLGCAHGPSHHGPLVHRFEKAEEWAKEFDDPARDAWQRPDAVVAAMGIAKGMTVADVGAGTGYFLPYLARAVGPTGKVLALDIEPDMVRYMRERAAREGLANVEARVVATDDPALPAGKVDRVLVVDTWHHIDARKAYAAKLAAALAPGGAVYVVDFTMEAKHGPPAHHRLARDNVERELASAGLAIGAANVALPEQYVVVAARK
jgi:ubiquinone/menaquinone biosynthesis C-methylase UbiE